MNHSIKITVIAAIVALSQNGLAGTITDTFNTGDTLTATKLNNVKTAVNANDAQITINSNDITDINTELSTVTNQIQEVSENQQREVAINCDADANTFINTTIANNTTYILTGICNGPIEINGRSNITITGDDIGVKDDGISLAANVATDFPSALTVQRTQNLILDNLSLIAYSRVSSSANDNSRFTYNLNINKGSSASLYNIDIVGGDVGLGSYDAASVRLFDGNTISGFLESGIEAGRNSVIGIRGTISVIGGTTPTPSSVPNVLVASHNATIRIKESGNTFTPSPSANNYDGNVLNASWNGVINVRDSNLNGNVVAENGGNININGSDIDGEVRAERNSVITINNTLINDDISTRTSSTIRIDNNSTIDGGGFDAASNSNIIFQNSTQNDGQFNIKQGANLEIYNSSIGYPSNLFTIESSATVTINNITITEGTGINIISFATFKHGGTASNMNGVFISCQYPEQYNDSGIVLNNLGTVSCP